jgi:cell division protein FtsB
MYLTGFTLFLAFTIARVLSLLATETAFEDRVAELEAEEADLPAETLEKVQKERSQKAALDKLSAKAD